MFAQVAGWLSRPHGCAKRLSLTPPVHAGFGGLVAQRGHEICRFAQAWMGKQAMAEQAMCIYIYIYMASQVTNG